jgi:HlyD family secretion protein
MDAKKLFRSAALEKLSSPERLDVMMRVTSPAAWLALSAVGAILALLVVWGLLGSIAIKVQGKGILLRGDAVLEVTSGANGRVTEILVKENETVKGGDVVARLTQPELDEKIRNKRSELEGAMAQAGVNQGSQSQIISRLRAQALELKARIETQEDAVRRGLLTNSQLLQTKQQLTQTEQQIATAQAGIGDRQSRVDQVRRELSELEAQLGTTTEVKSPYTGRVLEVTANMGDLLAPGSRVVALEAFEEPIEAVLFIPAADGKKIQPGMRAQISPSTIKQEEYGFILGDVVSVSDYPVTPERLKKVLRNEQLVQDLAGKSAPIEVSVKLLTDETTDSGFKWSSSKGPPMKVFSGTVCTANVAVEEKKPISYVLPIFKSTLGLS